MIHEMCNRSSIPDELYNLTQLADVTLAASRLSTTNIQTIKNYMQNEEALSLTELMPRKQSHEHPHHITNDELILERATHNDSGYTSDNEKLHKHNGLMTMMNPKVEHQRMVDSLYDLDATMSTTPKKLYADQRQHSFSSSEDDAPYNYSHKIFDKRKSRKLCYQSDDSMYLSPVKCSKTTFDKHSHGVDETEDSLLSISECDSNAGNYSSGKSMDCGSGTDDVHNCPECGKKYSTSSNLARHRQTHRSLLDKKARRCPHCDKIYVSMPAYSMHVRTHNQGCECPHCGKRFSRPWLLQGHIRTHTGEKPFKCSICTKSFADKSNLRAHIQTHSNTKPHNCARCGKAFALKSYLYKHEESSCMRNHAKAVAVATDKDPNKSPKTDVRTKSTRKTANTSPRPTSATGDAAGATKRMKSKQSSMELDGGAAIVVPNDMKINQECIILDVGSKKSYIDLTESRTDSFDSNCPRISVIRSVGAKMHDDASSHFNFYQEKPVDFSPRNKHHSSSSSSSLSTNSENPNHNAVAGVDSGNSNLVDISRQCATMMVM